MAFLITTSVSLAAECADDPNECTPKKLCEIATDTYGGDGNISWSAASSKAKHVTFAKGLGMSCGVIAALDPCDSDPNECKISQLCGKATIESAGQVSWDDSAEAYVALAKEYGLSCDIMAKIPSKEVVTDFKQAFKSEPKLKRQQLQYALNELGYYSYGADGLWGNGTSAAFDKFMSAYVLKGKTEAQVFSSLLSKTTVPSSFAVPKKKVAKNLKNKVDKNGLFPEYVCTVNEFVMKMPMGKISLNKSSTGSILVNFDGQRKKLNRKETKEAIKEFNLDQLTGLKFNRNKVTLNNPQMNAENWSELLRSASSEDRAKLKTILDDALAPQKYYIKKNIVSWSQKIRMPKDLGGAWKIDSSLNITTYSYISSVKGNFPQVGEMQVTTWSTCDPS